MIDLTVERDETGRVRAFTANNHGSSEVCAAVSMMVINTVNSIEALTEESFTCDYREDGGFIRFELTPDEGDEPGYGAGLLLDAMCLGLRSVKEQYESEIEIIEQQV